MRMAIRPEIDASAADLDLRMTEGDTIAFNFLVLNAGTWAGATWACEVRDIRSVTGTLLASLAVTATLENVDDLDVLITHAPVPELVASSAYWWDMQEVGGMTRFSGRFFVMPQVTDA
jgi:hypothetical protein